MITETDVFGALLVTLFLALIAGTALDETYGVPPTLVDKIAACSCGVAAVLMWGVLIAKWWTG